MISLSENDLANGLHVALGALFVTLPVAHGWFHGQLYGSLGGVVFSLLKEFWFDLKYETPETSGGLKGGCIDFVGYLVGIGLANLALWV